MQLQSKKSYFLTSRRLNLTLHPQGIENCAQDNKEGKKDKLKSTYQQIGQQKIKTKSNARKQNQAKQTKERKEKINK